MARFGVLAIGNHGDSDLGFVGERLREHHARIATVTREDLVGLRPPEAGTDLIVLLGSDWSVYDPAHRAAVAAEQTVVRRAHERGVPVLAICYGAQLVASTLGLTVTRAPAPEVGWYTLVTSAPEICPAGPWFQFHFDRWSDGRGVRSSAHTGAAPQAFRVGRTVAVQFHPEVTAPTARQWMLASPSAVAAAALTPDDVLASFAVAGAHARSRCHRFLDSFLEQVAGAEGSHVGRKPSGSPVGTLTTTRTSAPAAAS